MQYRKTSELKKLNANPRQIKTDDMQKLITSIKDNPDYFEARPLILSNRTGELVIIGGNQRFEASRQLGLEEVPTHLIEGLTEEREKEITIRDNINNGSWDWDVLANEWDLEDLEEWGLTVEQRVDKMEDGDEIEFEQSVQIEPPQEYIMIVCEPNSVDWEDLKEKLKLKMVRRGGYKKGSPFDDVGLERLIHWDDFKERYDNSSSK